MSNHQKGADIAELVGPLLKRLKLAKMRVPENSEMEKTIDRISTEVVKTKDILNSRKELDRELAGYFGKIERQIDPWIDHKPRENASDLPQNPTINEVGESSNTSYQKDKEVSKFQDLMDLLDSSHNLASRCLKSLVIFPENTELKKRLVIYWWIVLFHRDAKLVEKMFSAMVDKKLLIPVQREHNKVIDCFTIEPTFYKWLISSDALNYISFEKGKEGTWCLYEVPINIKQPSFGMLLTNLDQRYLNSKDIMDISSKHDITVFQLGNCCFTERTVHNRVDSTGSEEAKSKDHIEVDKTDFLEKLGKGVEFLSLRGISGIEELNESVGKLQRLKILDLRACHNLEKLPQKPRSTLKDNVWFENLKILDISGCYLLDHMPKWVCELSNLEVLKGFVVGSMGNKNQSCQLGDLSKLYCLRKLSIRFATNILEPEVFRGFNSIDNLVVLTITWGENKYKEIPHYSLPKNLKKLDIRCYPEADASKLQNPGELQNLKRLYIRGGNLIKIPCHDNWQVEILRLRFLEKLVCPTDWEELRSSFKNLKYVEYLKKDGNSWSKKYELGD